LSVVVPLLQGSLTQVKPTCAISWDGIYTPIEFMDEIYVLTEMTVSN